MQDDAGLHDPVARGVAAGGLEVHAGDPACEGRVSRGHRPASERPVEVGPAVAEHAPGMAVAADLVEVESRGQDLLAVVVGLGDDLARVVGDEGMPVEGDLELLAASRVPMRFEATSGMTFAAAWPCIVRCQCQRESSDGSCGSEPIAVG